MDPERPSVLRLVWLNTYLLSAVYLAVGLLTELALRFRPSAFFFRLSFALDALPSRALEFVGLLGPMRERALRGELSDASARLLLAGTTVLIIFVLALSLGMVLAGLRALAGRRD